MNCQGIFSKLEVKNGGRVFIDFHKYPRIMKESGISVAKLERETGLGNATIRGWSTSSPTVEKLKAVADYFGVTVDSLLADSD